VRRGVGGTGGADLTVPIGAHMFPNVRYQFLIAYTMREAAKEQALTAVSDALADGALPVGEAAGLPLNRFALADTARAQDALEKGAVGKVLVVIR
jgi:NADPH2:quinone reductase